MSNYSERISRILAESSLTLVNFCEKVGLNSTTTIAKIVSENRKPSSKTIGRIINAFPDISYEWLTTGRGEMQTQSKKPKEIREDDLTVTAKQILKKLQEDRIHYDLTRKEMNEVNFKQMFNKFNDLENRMEAYAIQASSTVNDKLTLLAKNYDNSYLVALDKILRIEQDLENINTFMAQAFETEKIQAKLKSKLKTKPNERT
tara:strand:+ start:176 stop:784 length:609 start_codon:yes stop_codon:yes gene_type:complete